MRKSEIVSANPYFTGTTECGLAQFNYNNGCNYRIQFINWNNYIMRSTGTFITIVDGGIKVGIGQKHFFNTFEEAKAATDMYMELCRKSYRRSQSGWASFIKTMEIIDTLTLQTVYKINFK